MGDLSGEQIALAPGSDLSSELGEVNWNIWAPESLENLLVEAWLISQIMHKESEKNSVKRVVLRYWAEYTKD